MVSYFPLFVFQTFLAWQVEPIRDHANELLKRAEASNLKASQNFARSSIELAEAKFANKQANDLLTRIETIHNNAAKRLAKLHQREIELEKREAALAEREKEFEEAAKSISPKRRLVISLGFLLIFLAFGLVLLNSKAGAYPLKFVVVVSALLLSRTLVILIGAL